MLLKSISYKDFRCFIGDADKNTINLSCTYEQNIIAILGDNTCGKSTIVQSLAWCFYGVANFDNPEIYNKKIARDLPLRKKTVPTVEVIFTHKDIEYTARRSQEFFKDDFGKMNTYGSKFSLSMLDRDTGETKPCGTTESEINRTINSMLPQDLSPYFFFAGEKSNELTTKSLSSAVRNLMGTEAYLKMRDHMRGTTRGVSSKSVLGYYEEKQSSDNDYAAKAEYKKKIEAEKKIEELTNRIDELSDNIEYYQNKVEDINIKLREAEPTKQLQRERDNIVADMRREQSELSRTQDVFLRDFNNNAVSLFIAPIIDGANERLAQMDLSDKGIVGLDVSAIRELLHRGRCLCDTDLKEGSAAYKAVEKYIDVLPPKSVGVLVKQLQDQLVSASNNGKEYVSDCISCYKAIQGTIQHIHELERREKDVSEKISNSGEMKTAEYENDLQIYKQRLRDARQEKELKIAERQRYESARELAENRYNELIGKAERDSKYATYYAYAKKIYEWVNHSYEQKEASIKLLIEREVAKLFNAMYNGHRSVKIDSNYNIVIDPPANTGGVKAIQYFAYVGGLVEVAKIIMKEKAPEDVIGEEYPLVLDAAFSHTDTTHTRSIAKELSTVTNQLVFAVMDKDWNHVSEMVESKIAREYILEKVDEDDATIVEVKNV